MLIATSLFIACLLALLAALDGSDTVAVWHVLVIAGTIAFIVGFDFPARMSFFPSLIRRDHMMSAVALNSMLWQGTRMFLPGLGGIIIALSDTWVVFALGAAGFATMSGVMASFPPAREKQAPPGPSGREFLDGLRFIATERLFLILIVLTYATTFFGISYVQLMPAFARMLGVGETGFGLILSATGVGSVTGTLLVATLQRSPRLGRLILASLGGAALAFLAFKRLRRVPRRTPRGLPARPRVRGARRDVHVDVPRLVDDRDAARGAGPAPRPGDGDPRHLLQPGPAWRAARGSGRERDVTARRGRPERPPSRTRRRAHGRDPALGPAAPGVARRPRRPLKRCPIHSTGSSVSLDTRPPFRLTSHRLTSHWTRPLTAATPRLG